MSDIVYRMSDIVYRTSDMILDVGYSISEGVIMQQPTQNKKRETDQVETDNVIMTHLAPHSFDIPTSSFILLEMFFIILVFIVFFLNGL